MSHPERDCVRVPESRCLNCGRRQNALATGNRAVAAEPEPGDIAICIYCGAVMRLADDLTLRGMTEDEIAQLTADRAWMESIARTVKAIQFMRHSMG